MGRAVFSSEAEKKFLELWSDTLRNLDKTMTSRAEKVAYVTKCLNSYMKEIGSTKEYSAGQVNHKVDTSKAKGHDLYRKHLRRPTGCSNDSNLGQVDLEAAFLQWNFRTHHTRFSKHPTWGPESPIEIAVGEYLYYYFAVFTCMYAQYCLVKCGVTESHLCTSICFWQMRRLNKKL